MFYLKSFGKSLFQRVSRLYTWVLSVLYPFACKQTKRFFGFLAKNLKSLGKSSLRILKWLGTWILFTATPFVWKQTVHLFGFLLKNWKGTWLLLSVVGVFLALTYSASGSIIFFLGLSTLIASIVLTGKEKEALKFLGNKLSFLLSGLIKIMVGGMGLMAMLIVDGAILFLLSITVLMKDPKTTENGAFIGAVGVIMIIVGIIHPLVISAKNKK